MKNLSSSLSKNGGRGINEKRKWCIMVTMVGEMCSDPMKRFRMVKMVGGL